MPKRETLAALDAQLKRNATRSASLDGYAHDGNRITSPGKFEGEPIFAPHYWNIALEGFADADNGTAYTFKFTNDQDDFALWPELRQWLGRKRTLVLIEDDQGFIHCR
jgi:hypothetical protein